MTALSSGVTSLASRPNDGTSEPLKQPSRRPHEQASSRNLGDRIFGAVTGVFAAAIIAVAALIFIVLLVDSLQPLSRFGLGFLSGTSWNVVTLQFGLAPALIGTLYVSFLALLIAAPVGLLIAVFLSETAPRQIRTVLGFVIELLAAVPSIVYGLWALLVLVPLLARFEPTISSHFGGFFLFSGASPTGQGILAAVLILSIMILPTIAAISRDVMIAVPNAQREAMLALGATRWETTWKVIVPYARAGIIGGILLALGRAVGETMAVQMVIGSSQSLNFSLLGLGTTIPATLVNQFAEATPGSLFANVLIEAALVLFILSVIINASARLLVWRVNRKFSA
ncbi:MAG TPA: phosphate ABC transporter permease subunit PstC [Chloroflexota bacterium]|nr:phosphate ABC transporter permease subunit PstC [Chloroflexota bacterium]